MDLDELQSVRDRERQTDKLQQLRTSFYADAGEFIQDLRERRQEAAERADEPFDSPEVSRLSDEIDTAEQTVEAIYEKRVGKIVKAASFAAADLPTEVDGMTAEETDLFESLVENIRENRQHVLDVLSGPLDEETADLLDDAEETVESPTRPRVSDDEADVNPADLMGSGEATVESSDTAEDHDSSDEDAEADSDDAPLAEPDDEPPVRNDGGAAGVDRETVKITDDVGAILGVDQREYDLSPDDVVTLPAANAEPLLDRDAATRLD